MDQNMALLLTAYEKLHSINPLIVAADGRIRKSLFSPIRRPNSNQLPSSVVIYFRRRSRS
jgi:hypothetical protein